MAKRTELPDYLRDVAQNKFVTGLLEKAKGEGNDLFIRIGNDQIDKAIAQTRAFFPEAYSEELAALHEIVNSSPSDWAS